MATNNADRAILFQSRVNYAKMLINNVSTLGTDTSKYSRDVDNLLFDVRSKVKSLKGTEKLAAKMTVEATYLEANTKIDEIILSLDRHIIGYQIKNNCDYVNKMQDISSAELRSVVDSLISSLKNLKKSDPNFMVEYSSLVAELYEAIYKVIKLEYMANGLASSRLFDYVLKDKSSRSYIWTLIIKEVNALRSTSADLSKLDLLINKAKEEAFDDDVCFSADIIKEIIKVSHGKELETIFKKTTLDLRKRYTDNFNQSVESCKQIEKCEEEVAAAKNDLKSARKRKLKDISTAIVSSVLSVSFLGILLVGPFFIKHKKVKTTTTITNTLSNAIDINNEYLAKNIEATTYLEMFDPWVKTDNGRYLRYVYRLGLPYDEYCDKDIAEIIAYDNLETLLDGVSTADKKTEYAEELSEEDFYAEPWFRFVKKEQDLDDYIYERTVKNNAIYILFGMLFCVEHLKYIAKCYEDLKWDVDNCLPLLAGVRNTVLWLNKQKDAVWDEEILKEYEERITLLLRRQEELRNQVGTLEDENDEIEEILSKMMADPTIAAVIKQMNLELEANKETAPKDKKDSNNVLQKSIIS